jgi:hypothetical protein
MVTAAVATATVSPRVRRSAINPPEMPRAARNTTSPSNPVGLSAANASTA